jgi:hypothetical protein
MRSRNHFTLQAAILGLSLFCAHHDVYAQWVATSKPLDMSIKALASNSTTLFVGGNCYDEVAKKEFGCMLRSANKGKDWQKTSLKGGHLRALAVSGQVIFAGCEDGVYRSSDNGQTWAKGYKGLTDASVWSLAISGQNVLAGTETAGVFLSDFNGQNWKPTNLKNARVDSMAVNASSVLAGTEGDGIWLSTDSGQTWQDITAGIPDSYILAVGFKGTTILGASMENGIYLTTNNGKAWKKVNETPGLRAIVPVSGSVFASGNGGGPLSSDTAGQSWMTINKGLGTKALYGVWSLAGQGADVFAGGDDHVVYRIADVSPITKLMNYSKFSLTIDGCQAAAGRAGAYICSTRAGLSKCQDLERGGKVDACFPARK